MKYINEYNNYSFHDNIKIGGVYWFEYHCLESDASCDANIWYHSHQKVKILSIVTMGCCETFEERGREGEPRVYKVKFKDGFVADVFEDEIVQRPEDFNRPDPPTKNKQL